MLVRYTYYGYTYYGYTYLDRALGWEHMKTPNPKVLHPNRTRVSPNPKPKPKPKPNPNPTPSPNPNPSPPPTRWHMTDGAVLGVHDGMVIEYEPTTL